jgi:hypothetical protein
MPLHRMQVQSQSSQCGILKRHLSVRGIEDHGDVLIAAEVAAVCVEFHDDEAGRLARAYVQEMQVALHFGESVHVEQPGSSADPQEIAKGVASVGGDSKKQKTKPTKGVFPMQQLSKQPAFELGQIVATPGALAALKKAGQQPGEFLTRHVNRE